MEPIRVTLRVQDQQETPVRLEPDILPKIIEGISPTIELNETESAVEITVSDKNHTESAVVPKGNDYVITQDDIDQIAEQAAESAGITDVLDEINQIAYGTHTDGTPVAPGTPHYENSAEYWAGVAGAATVHQPTIGQNGNWFVWDQQTGQYVDTTLPARGPKGDQGDAGVDVQINGTSITAQGVANIPIAGSQNFGVMKVSTSYGHQILSGILQHKMALDTTIKTGTDSYDPIVSNNAYCAVFYGLAKAAGYDLKNATVTLGTYPDEAINAILTMLGVYNRILTPTGNTHTLLPCPFSYSFGEKSELTVTVTATSQYHFMFSSPSDAACVLTMNGITGTSGDEIEAGKTYEVDVWAGIALIKEVEVTAV